MAIPRKIFQTARSYEGLQQDYKDNVEKLKTLNPGWDYRFFGDEEMKFYLREHLSPVRWALLQEVNPKFGVVFADVFRYLVIFNEGGVYLDIKSTADQPFDDILPPDTEYVLSQWPNKIGQKFERFGLHPDLVHVAGGEFQQWHVMARPGHPFLKAVLDKVFSNLERYTPKSFGTNAIGVLRLTGPIAYTEAIYPLLDHLPHTVLELDRLGMFYSIYEKTGDKQRHEKHAAHYSLVKEPIVLRDVYVEPVAPRIQSIGEMLATLVRENIDLILKLGIVTICATATALVVLPLLLIWLLR